MSKSQSKAVPDVGKLVAALGLPMLTSLGTMLAGELAFALDHRSTLIVRACRVCPNLDEIEVIGKSDDEIRALVVRHVHGYESIDEKSSEQISAAFDHLVFKAQQDPVRQTIAARFRGS